MSEFVRAASRKALGKLLAAPGVRRVARRKRERGQALLEFSLFFVFLLVLLGGVINIGTLLNDHLNIVYAARQGARTGAVLGQAPDADCAILGAVHAALANMPSLQIKTITVYKAGDDGLPVDSKLQDIYTGDMYCSTSNGDPAHPSGSAAPVIYEGSVPVDAGKLQGWPPSARNTQLLREDSLGVRIDYIYAYQFPLVGNGVFQSYDYAVMPLSPSGIPTPPPTQSGPPPQPTNTPCPPRGCPPTPTPTDTPTPLPTATPTPTNTPCPGRCPTPTPVPTDTPVPPTPTNTPCPQQGCPTATPTFTPQATATPTNTPTPPPPTATPFGFGT